MSMSEYELSLVSEAKKGKKKALERLHDALHKTLCDVVEQELGDQSRAEAILRSTFEKLRVEIKTISNPAQFEDLAIRLTAAECRNYPRSANPSPQGSGATKFTAYKGQQRIEENKQSGAPSFMNGFSNQNDRMHGIGAGFGNADSRNNNQNGFSGGQGYDAPVQTPDRHYTQPSAPQQQYAPQPKPPVQQYAEPPKQQPYRQPSVPQAQQYASPVNREPYANQYQRQAPQTPVQEYAPKPPAQEYAPKPPVQQYTPQPKPPVQQYAPKPPVQQYAPQPKPPVQQYTPQPKPPVQQYTPQPKPPVQQYAPQPTPQQKIQPPKPPVRPVPPAVAPPVKKSVPQPEPAKAAPADKSIKAWLVCVNGADRGKEYPIYDKVNTIGNSSSNDIQVHNEDKIAKKNHVSIVYNRRNTECTLDIGAAGKVCVNGKEYDRPRVLKKFDIVTIGNAQLVFAPFSEGLEWKKNFGL